MSGERGSDRQLDLFSAAGFSPDVEVVRPAEPALSPAELDDAALIAAILSAGQANCHDLAGEAGRRRLTGAVAALESLCRRFRGFGLDHAIPEQTAALSALATIGGFEAATAVTRIIVDQVVQGPGLQGAMGAAARLGAKLPANTAAPLLRHAAPEVRADACRCARGGGATVALLIELLNDLNASVAQAAACALGRLGRHEARSMLLGLLLQDPSSEVIEAVADIADQDCIVLLGRVGLTHPELAARVVAALEGMEEPIAIRLAETIRRSLNGVPTLPIRARRLGETATVILIKDLANLGAIPGPRTCVVCASLKLADSDGGPARAIALEGIRG